MKQAFNFLNRSIWLVSLVSLFTDMASEMLYPIMPLYLKQIGFTVVGLGFLEGLAEALSGLSKPYFGHWSDVRHRRSPFIQWGYALSALAKPALGVFQSVGAIFLFRSADRLGKGIRSGARDALLTDLSTPNNRGKVFGLHRAMDTLGAVLGPAVALIYLARYPGEFQPLFLWAFVPGVLAIVLTWFIADNTIKGKVEKPSLGFSMAGLKLIWQTASPRYKQVLLGLAIIATVNSSDMFLLLRAIELGLNETEAVMAYLCYNVVYALAAFPMGFLADRFGFKPLLLVGFLMLACVYAALLFPLNTYQFVGVLLLYGLYAAATEGLSKAWISTLCSPTHKAGAQGLFQGVQSVGVLIASGMCGWLWFAYGSHTAFGLTIVGVLIGMAVLFRVPEQNE